MLAGGEIKTGNDFREAAYLFQHGGHILMMEAVFRGTLAPKFIEAATLDRYLQSLEEPQVFVTLCD